METSNLWNMIHRWGRCCSHCGSFGVGNSQFCEVCETDLWDRHPIARAFELAGTHIPAWTLFDWFPDEDRKVSKLMISLKGGQMRAAFQFYAQAFVSRMELGTLPSDTVLVPCPSSKGRFHALVWAQSLAQVLGLPITEALELETPSQGSQKHKSWSDRQKIRFRRTHVLRHKHVIFIDDIVTTGATAIAAQKALGPTLGFEVWCLAHRRQLATEPLF